MSAKYSLTLTGVNKLSPVVKGAAADVGDLTSTLRKQQQAARALNATQKNLGRYAELRQGMAATRADLQRTQNTLKALSVEQAAAKSSVAGLAAEKQAATRKVKRLAAAIDKAGVPTAALSAEFKAAKSEADRLGGQLDAERARLKKLGSDFDAAKADASGLKTTLDKQRASAHKLGNELRDVGVDTGSFAREQSRLRKETLAANTALDAQKASMKKLGAARSRASAADARMAEAQGDIAGVAALSAAAVIPVGRAVKMEAAMADVAKVTDFKGDEKDRFQSDLQRLAVDVNIPPEQLTEIAAAAGQSGVAKNELAGFTGSAARMGVAFDMAAADAGETMAAWRAGMGLNQQQAEQLADAVNHVSNNMNAKARDISGVLKRQGAVAKASGLGEVQAASLAGSLLAGGASEEVAATTMKNLLGALTKGDAATSSQQQAMGALGLDAGQLASGMQSDAVGTIQTVFEALADAPVEKQSALISQLFGEESKGGIMPLLKNQVLLQQAFTLTADETKYLGSALDEYENRAGVSEHRLGSAWRAIDRLGLVLGDSLLPVVGPAADGVAWAVTKLADLAEAGGSVTTAVTLTTAAFVAYKAGMLATRLARAKIEQMRAGSAVKAAEKEARLAAKTNDTATKAGLAARALDRLNGSLSRTASVRGGVAGVDGADDKQPKKTKGKPRRAGRRGRLGRLIGSGWNAAKSLADSKAGRLAGYGAGAAALMAVPEVASAGEVMGTASDVVGGLSDLASGLGGMATKLLKPLDILLQGGNLVSVVSSGDALAVGASAGDIVGGAGGMWAGGAAGAAIGSVVPVIGTAIGGAIGAAIGGYTGGEGGGWLGERIAGLFKSDDAGTALKKADEQIAKTQTQNNQQNQQITFAPQITVQAVPGDDAERVANLAMEKLRQMFDQQVVPVVNPSLPGRLDDSMEITA